MAILALVAVIFGIYPSLLEWRSARNRLQLTAEAGLRLRILFGQCNVEAEFPGAIRSYCLRSQGRTDRTCDSRGSPDLRSNYG